MKGAVSRGWEKVATIHRQHDKTLEKQLAEVNASTDPNIVYFLESNDLIRHVRKSTPAPSKERVVRLAEGPEAQAVADACIELSRIEEMKRMGQATHAEVEAARERAFTTQAGVDMAEFEWIGEAEFSEQPFLFLPSRPASFVGSWSFLWFLRLPFPRAEGTLASRGSDRRKPAPTTA
ncbi:MAG: hypothetical protein M2R45_05420 [Verrucomicrobia subdivision 3 bacterium]|nr:hypothetical protein [Limisphaerales bacterium]MCS1417869.1 hypothetical protein [Limisphaerales bacterium]